MDTRRSLAYRGAQSTMKFPVLYHKGKNDEIRQWTVETIGSKVQTTYGVVGGKMQKSSTTAKPTNVGKSNVRDAAYQAESEAHSLWKHKLDRKYSQTVAGAKKQLLFPMLAHSFKGTKKNRFRFPADIQPKLDGVRCLAWRETDGSIQLTSRQGKEWDINFIAEQLDEWLPEHMILDGEIYIHGESCQRVTSLAKSANMAGKSYKPESDKLMYHVYDVPAYNNHDAMPWSERSYYLMEEVQTSYSVETVLPYEVENEQRMKEMHGSFMHQGYEGSILRAHDGLYAWGYRSADLLKVKEFQDGEFVVLKAKEGKGKMKGCVIWTCQNDLNKYTFETTMKCSMAKRKKMFDNADVYIGKKLTVKYFDRTDRDIPRFPIGTLFRDVIDLP